ncbi:hypothetical protein CRUP_027923 [Coryphaenoides rupestris]|nr:hypothetical protein CRUP_027923 [Coryphaenoides rupestris]
MSTRMERTFYEDPLCVFSSQQDPAGFGSKKTSMRLDLGHIRTGDLLTSPDVGLLKLASPELERLIIQSGLVTTTPTPTPTLTLTLTPTPTRFLCPRTVTDEQEGFAEGFVRALAELHHQHTPSGISEGSGTSGGSTSGESGTSGGSTSGGSGTSGGSTSGPPATGLTNSVSSGAGPGSPLYEDLNTFDPTLGTSYSSSAFSFSAAPQAPGFGSGPVLKEEPQTVPEMPGETPPLTPIDMERQERIKADRKKMRNRIAASKCRKRKLERISRLEDKVKNLKSQNSELSSTANLLRDQVAHLKQKVMDHVTSGCQLMLTQQLQTF